MATLEEELFRQMQLGQGAGYSTLAGEAVEPPAPPADLTPPAPSGEAAILSQLDAMLAERQAREGRQSGTLFGSNATESERALIELDRMIAAKLPNAPLQTGHLRHGLGAFNQSLANLGGALASPILGPLTRPDAASSEGQAFAAGTGMEQLKNDVGRSQAAAQAFFRALGFIPSDQPPTPTTLMERIGSDLVQAALVAASTLWGAQYASRLAGTAFLRTMGLTGGPATAAGPSTVPGMGAVGRGAAQIRARPVTFASDVVGAQPAGTTTRETLSPAGEAVFGRYEDAGAGAYTGRLLWDFATEALGGGVGASTLRRIGRSRIGFIPDAETLSPLTRPGGPIMGHGASPETAAGTIRAQAVTTIDAFDRMIASAIDQAAAPGVSQQAAGIRLHGSLAAAREFAHETTQRAYAAVPNAQGNPSDLIDEMLALMALRRAESGGVGQNVDLPYLGELQQQLFRKNADGSLYINPTTGNPQFRTDVTLREIIAIRSEIMHRADRAADSPAAGGQGRRVERELLERLHTAATQDIERWLVPGSPGHQAWQYANNLYRVFNERFRRGPVERMLRTGPYSPEAAPGVTLQPGQASIPPIELARQLVRADDTAEAVFQASLRFGLAANAGPHLRAAMNAAATGVRLSSEDAISALFRDELADLWTTTQARTAGTSRAPDVGTAFDLSPQPGRAVQAAANRFMQQNEHLLRSWTGVTTDMWRTVNSLNSLMRARNEYTTSIVSQFIGGRIDDVIRTAMDAPDRVARFADLYSAVRHNADALEGVRRAAINRLFDGHGADPNIALARLQSAPYREALTELFRGDTDRLNRLYDLVRVATDIIGPSVTSTARGSARLDERGVTQALGPIAAASRSASINLAGMFLGLVPGHLIARMLPGAGSAAQLSIPLRMSTAARKMVASAWLGDRANVLSIIRDAVFDPTMETYIRMLGPGSHADATRQFQFLSRWLRRAQQTANGDVQEYLEGNWRAAEARERRAFFEDLDRVRKGPFR